MTNEHTNTRTKRLVSDKGSVKASTNVCSALLWVETFIENMFAFGVQISMRHFEFFVPLSDYVVAHA